MDVVIGITGAATIASLLVSIFKFGVPSASSKLIAVVAFLCGQLSALGVQAAGDGIVWNQKVVAVMFITGVLGTAAAMGIRAADAKADSQRVGSEIQTLREVDAELGAKQEQEAQQ